MQDKLLFLCAFNLNFAPLRERPTFLAKAQKINTQGAKA
jgi:hypothetical protein